MTDVEPVEQILAVVQAEQDEVAEVSFRRRGSGGTITCEVCVTTTEGGTRTTVCQRIPCPQSGGRPRPSQPDVIRI